MKLAWLCYHSKEEYMTGNGIVLHEEPERWKGYWKIVPIAYSEVVSWV